jgi:cobalt-zinc-cadmium efflux system membrane fusion protein
MMIDEITDTHARVLVAMAVTFVLAAVVGCTDGDGGSSSESSATPTSKTHASSSKDAGREPTKHADESGHGKRAGKKPHGHHDQKDHSGSNSNGHSAHNHLKLTESIIERYGLETSEAEAGRLAGRVTAPARIDYPPNKRAHISPLVSSRIAETHVSVGDRVDPGETLATLRSIELGRARAAVDEARAEREVAESNFERLKKLYEQDVVAERRFLAAKGELETARANLQAARSEIQTYGVSSGHGPFYSLTADVGGRVVSQHAAPGEVKSPSEPLFTVASADEVWVVADVSQAAIRKVEVGMSATVLVDAYPARSWKGKIDWVAQQVDDENRTLPIRVALSNKNGVLKPGMYADVLMFPGDSNKHALVPVGAIQKVHGRRVVFVPTDKPQTFKPVTVDVGAEQDGMAEILSGLAPGDSYVSSGAFDLKATATAAARSASHSH